MKKMGGGVAAAVVALAATGVLAAVTLSGGEADAPDARVITIPSSASTAPAASTGTSATVPTTTAAQAYAAAAAAAVSAATATSTAKVLPGINISGGEFGGAGGKLGTNYIYPSTAEMRSYAAQGFKLLRVPFRWERLQPNLYGPLSEVDRKALKSVVTQANALGLTVILDMHNYGARQVKGSAALVGSGTLATTALTNAWVKIMEDYRSNPKVWIGLMNEPNRQTAAQWWAIAGQVTKDIRAQKISNKLLIPGTAWTGAHNWVSSGNAAQAVKFVDPGKNYAFEVHQYLDAWSTGTTDKCEVKAGQRVNAALTWAEKYKVKLFFGEIGASGQPQCAKEYPDMLRRLKTSSAVLGWTAWGGGAWWAYDYMFRLQSRTTTPTAHMKLLLANMP